MQYVYCDVKALFTSTCSWPLRWSRVFKSHTQIIPVSISLFKQSYKYMAFCITSEYTSWRGPEANLFPVHISCWPITNLTNWCQDKYTGVHRVAQTWLKTVQMSSKTQLWQLCPGTKRCLYISVYGTLFVNNNLNSNLARIDNVPTLSKLDQL